MSRPLLSPLAVFVCLGAGSVGCKKKTPPQPTVVEVSEPVPELNPVPVAGEVQVPDHVKQMVQNFQRIHFDFDSDLLSQSGRDALLENVAIMQANPQIKVQLQGHADERGTTDYNLALGQKRANAVRQYMEASGISGSRLTITSYGEEVPRSTGNSEQAWSQNRRCEFMITWGGGANVKGTDESP